MSYVDLIKKDCSIDILKNDTVEKLQKAIEKQNIKIK